MKYIFNVRYSQHSFFFTNFYTSDKLQKNLQILIER